MAQIGSFNSVILFGRLGKDPEYREGQQGKRSFCRFSLATSEKYKEDAKPITDWHIITAFGKQADWCAQYLQKGDPVFVEGKLSVTFYNNNRYKIKRVLKRYRIIRNDIIKIYFWRIWINENDILYRLIKEIIFSFF